MSDLSKMDALQSENNSLKMVIETLRAEVHCSKKAFHDVLDANLSLKVGCFLLEENIKKTTLDNIDKEKRILSLEQQISELTSKLYLSIPDSA